MVIQPKICHAISRKSACFNFKKECFGVYGGTKAVWFPWHIWPQCVQRSKKLRAKKRDNRIIQKNLSGINGRNPTKSALS